MTSKPPIRSERTVDTELLTGMIKGQHGASMVMILDAAQCSSGVNSTISPTNPAPIVARGRIVSTRGDDGGSGDATENAATRTQLVSFEVAGQEYAFPIEEVQEIVQIAGACHRGSQHPGTRARRDHIAQSAAAAGLLREMFGLPPAEVTEANKVVVVSLGEGAVTSVGVVMDSIKEVLAGGSLGDRCRCRRCSRRTDRWTISNRSAGWTMASALSRFCRRVRCSTSTKCARIVRGETEGSKRWRRPTRRSRSSPPGHVTTTRSSSSCSA